ncbi:MAG: hypothetical protein A3I89_02275 [Candidatus Harrisonbacteria bacterium RIFCSPLOWO2_02_FULL_41_11]|uniref:General secretion pathway GspH domain-containing protein n=1 Tax=Candidatus Harrisonbacteria bacterium RIFCSPHIGHO2_02_FULL_42_16 TaxID=1798404 RepID=A0A1G1ZHY8_9BACT|nr:MAG: hypothetical protein A3B92_03565 [Candidatus Harrisonbacteria bacterium RIFCSPHIGHO2_02_FULL_42_16]OGY66618.1 MAG: hypothetical protein A3I89_02275 [Candidatus Harrisonbacteria bacterium RIFCSPLOWO2_02_FULL_41_11]
MRGFTLMELMVVAAITLMIAGISALTISFSSPKNLDLAFQELISHLRDAQQRAIVQDQNERWGMRINAVSGDRDFYEVFYGAGYSNATVTEKIFLSSKVEFVSPAQGNTKDILFFKKTGFPDAGHTIILLLIGDPSKTKSVTIDSNTGLID